MPSAPCSGLNERLGLFSLTEDHAQADRRTLADFLIKNQTTPSSMNSAPAVSRQLFWICRRNKGQNFLLLSKRKHAIILLLET